MLWLLLLITWTAGAQETARQSEAGGRTGTISVDTYNSLAVTADRSGLVRVYDITRPDEPAGLSTLTLPMKLSEITLSNNFALVAGEGGVQVLDLSNPQLPLVGHKINLEGEVEVVKAAGNLGYAAVGSSVLVFDLVTGAILDRRVYSTLPVSDIALSKDSLYLLSSDTGSGSRYQVTKLAIRAGLGDPVASFTSEVAQSGVGRMSLYVGNGLVYVASAAVNRGPADLAVLEDSDSTLVEKALPQHIAAEIARPMGRELLTYTGNGLQGVPVLQVMGLNDPSKTIKAL